MPATARPTPKEYTERHHIIPKCIGGTNVKSNIVRLTPKEHRLCHLLLVKMVSKAAQGKMVFAAKRMADKCIKVLGMSKGSYYNFLREQVKDASSKLNKGRPACNKGSKHTDEIKKLCGTFSKGKKWYNNGIEESTFLNNFPIGWVKGRLKQSISAAGHNARQVTFRGVLYPSIIAAVNATGVSSYFIKRENVFN